MTLFEVKGASADLNLVDKSGTNEGTLEVGTKGVAATGVKELWENLLLTPA